MKDLLATILQKKKKGEPPTPPRYVLDRRPPGADVRNRNESRIRRGIRRITGGERRGAAAAADGGLSIAARRASDAAAALIHLPYHVRGDE